MQPDGTDWINSALQQCVMHIDPVRRETTDLAHNYTIDSATIPVPSFGVATHQVRMILFFQLEQ